MFKLCWLLCFLLLQFSKLSTSHPFIFERFLNTCSYDSSFSKLSFTNQVWKVESSNIIIYYTLCGYLPEEICGPKAAACLKNKEYSNILGKQFILENGNYLELDNGNVCKVNSSEKYRVTIKFQCDQQMPETYLKKKSDCDYNIYMTDPKCSCVTTIEDQLIDLRKLKGNYFVKLKEANFSIALCGAKQNCTKNDSDISVCKKHGDGIIPLSRSKNERIIYNENKNEITFRGSYKRDNKVIKKFELLLKCDWEIDIGEIIHRELSTQGKEYKFIMNSSYGCVKLPPKCVVEELSLIYNLTNLFNSSGYQVLNVPKGTIYLNICGPLSFKHQPENSCSKSFSQVCELKDGNYINRGSITSRLVVVDDVIQLTYSHGKKCKEDPLRQYSTHIHIFCSGTDLGPTFSKANGCDLFINWNTPHACPTYNKSSCEYEPKEDYDCSVTFQKQRYDLSILKLHNNSHEISNPVNKNIKYFLNLCGSVIDPEAPCMKDSMVIMKDMTQNNVKYRTKSLGKIDLISIVNKHIVITTLSGTYCGAEGDYTSSLRLICDTEEKKPILANNTECTFNFEWRTPHGCLNKTLPTKKQCLIKDNANDISLDFTKSKKISVKININERHYVFDICKDSYTECLADHCEDIPLVKHLTSSNSTTFLEMSLPKICNNESVINKVIFELLCDEIQYNEYFKLKEQVNNCTLKLFLYTSLVCGREEYQIDSKDENGKYLVLDENTLSPENKNCSVTNYITGYQVYLTSLNLNISTVCPTVYFFEHNTSVVLIYPNSKICNKSTLHAKYEYKAVLKCSNQELHEVEKMDCFEVHHLEGPEFCKLFEFSTLDKPQNSSNTVTIVFSIIGAIIFLGVCLFCFYKWKVYSRRISYLTVYKKDGDL